MALHLTVVDAFTDKPFQGNPAAVAVLDAPLSEQAMQRVAAEMNLAETAFAVRRVDGDHDLRWFTPTTEVDLCGHATLATTLVLGGQPTFHTRSGRLGARLAADGWVHLDLPADPPESAPVPEGLGAALGATPVGSWRSRLFAVLELADAATVRALTPDLAALAAVERSPVLVTAPSDQPGCDVVSRVFAPMMGIPEDPVTGSAHCVLACLWGERLGREELVGYQASTRGGRVRMARAADRVHLAGRAVVTAEVQVVAPLP